jgi:hypothetical protein
VSIYGGEPEAGPRAEGGPAGPPSGDVTLSPDRDDQALMRASSDDS